ncbi:hypothetical protein [Nonomuraea sp. NPDC001831]|uniref:hypothetical protein n=1 Tax=Nonomuraea sp. NPDC001831 TaxID=3364340 RepID=UPI00369E11D7
MGPQPEDGATWGPHPQDDAGQGPRPGNNPARGPQPEDDTSWTPDPGQWAATPEEDPPAWPGQSAAPGTPQWEQPGPVVPGAPQREQPGPVVPGTPQREQPGPVVPGAPPWEPPPAFTAAAAGLQVWPAPVADPHTMPPWPAATGELVAEPDTDEPSLGDPTARFPTPQAGHPGPPAAAGHQPTQFPTPPTDTPTGPSTSRPTAPPVHPSTAAAATSATGVPTDPNATAPAFPHDPATPYDQDAAPYAPGHPPYPADALDTPDTAPHDAPDAVRFGTEPGQSGTDAGRLTPKPGQSGPDAGRFTPEPGSYDPEAGSPTPEAGSYDPDATRPGGIPKAAHYFDPEAAKRDAAATVQQHATPAAPHDENDPAALDTPTQGMRASDPREEPTGPMRTAHHVEPHPTNPTGRPPEPGDVPVWPPAPPAEEKRPEDRHPDERPDAATQRATGHAPDTPAQTTHPAEQDEPRRSPELRPDPSPTQERLPDLPFNQDLWTKRPGTALDLPTPPQGTPAFPPGAFRQPPFQIPPPPPPARGKSKRALLVTLGALALAGVATGGFFAYRALSTAPPAATTAGATPAPPTLLPTTELTTSPPADVPGASMLNSEETDPKKMSVTEAFPKKKVSAAGTTFTRVKTDTETSCDKAATGAFADALRERKCSRIIRATFVDSKRRYAVTTGIAVLPTKEDAVQTDLAKNLPRNVWFRALPGAKGSGGERVSIAGGYAAGLVWGRYIVFSYATHADGHTPDAGDKTLAKVSGAFRDQTSLVLERRVTKG